VGEERVAKVYKEAQDRTFRQRSGYTEGRKTRNSRDQRAINKRTRHGRAQDEAAWRSAEVDVIYRLRDAGVSVPEPHAFVDGVLVMELIKDSAGLPAPRLGDLVFEPNEASAIYHQLIRETARMLCAGVVHADLSEFNVLMGAQGPAVIDFPQAVDPARNQNARRLLLRDVENLHRFRARFAPKQAHRRYGEEMWKLYSSNDLTPDTELAGNWQAPTERAETADVMALIQDANEEEHERRVARGLEEEPEVPARRRVVDFKPAARTGGPRSTNRNEPRSGRGSSERPVREQGREQGRGAQSRGAQSGGAQSEKPSRRRRRRTRGGSSTGDGRADSAEKNSASGRRDSGSATPRTGQAPGQRNSSKPQTARGSGQPATSGETRPTRRRRSRRRKPKPTEGASNDPTPPTESNPPKGSSRTRTRRKPLR